MVIQKATANTFGGALQVFIDDVTAGHTQGGAEIAFDSETTPIQVDDFGATPVDLILLGNPVTVTINFAQIEPEVMALAIPGASLTASGTLELATTIGTTAQSVAKKLVLSGTNGTTSHQYTFHKVVAAGGSSVSYAPDAQTIDAIEFQVLVDPTLAAAEATDSIFKYETFAT